MNNSSRTGRLLLVSNRLPVTIRRDGATCEVRPSAGGLATALGDVITRRGGRWIGWDGTPSAPAVSTDIEDALAARGLCAVPLTHAEVEHYYETFSNGVVWPLFHYLLDRLPLDDANWPVYQAVNQRFADAVAAEYEPGDTIWVHDYHLLLLPGLLRERLPDATIGFFLHIPFPSSEVIRILPWRKEILQGLLGADLVGFHTRSYARHFLAALDQVMGLEPSADRVAFEGREVRFGPFPIGIDARRFGTLAEDAEVQAMAQALREDAGGRQILLGVDRLDYTKGIPRRLLAFEQLLERNPGLHNRVRLVQVAVPSRGGVASYQAFRRQVEEMVGRINGRYGTAGWVPVHYLHRSLDVKELVALYRAADVMLVTPLRDGMNLVAKEFVASRPDDDGVLVLSEFAGAADELQAAVQVNPYDIGGTASALSRALTMPQGEQRERMRRLRAHVQHHDVHRWTRGFLNAVAAAHDEAFHPLPRSLRLARGTTLAHAVGWEV